MLSSISAALAFTALTHCCLAAPASLNNPEAVDSSLAVRQNPYCQDHQGETGRYTLILDDYVKCEGAGTTNWGPGSWTVRTTCDNGVDLPSTDYSFSIYAPAEGWKDGQTQPEKQIKCTIAGMTWVDSFWGFVMHSNGSYNTAKQPAGMNVECQNLAI